MTSVKKKRRRAVVEQAACVACGCGLCGLRLLCKGLSPAGH